VKPVPILIENPALKALKKNSFDFEGDILHNRLTFYLEGHRVAWFEISKLLSQLVGSTERLAIHGEDDVACVEIREGCWFTR
jgi:hypothetical protein